MSIIWRNRLILLSPTLAVAILAVVPATEDGPTVCPFALFTGTACPGCGMTRAASRLIRGDFAAAMSFHPLVPAIVVVALGGWIWLLLRRTGRVQPLSNRVLNGILIATLVGLIGVWIARLATGTLPPVASIF